MDFKTLVVIMMGAALIDNYVLRKFLAVCPLIGVSKELKSSVGIGFCVLFLMITTALATWPVYHYLLVPYGLVFMQTVVFIIVLATMVQIIEIVLKRYIPALFKSLGIYLPLMTTNCAVVGAILTNINKEYTYIEAVTNSFGAGIGFMLAMVLFTNVRKVTESANPPGPFKGAPISLISAAILSLAFFAFEGVIENLFG